MVSAETTERLNRPTGLMAPDCSCSREPFGSPRREVMMDTADAPFRPVVDASIDRRVPFRLSSRVRD
jgi:hypothetical protein